MLIGKQCNKIKFTGIINQQNDTQQSSLPLKN